MPEILDMFGIPTFYATHCVIDDAGNGNVRILNCTMRGGVMVPNSEVIIPAARLMEIGDDVRTFAQQLFSTELMPITIGRH